VAPAAAPWQAHPLVSAPRILIVEDDADIREAMAECLASDGLATAGAENGAVALSALRAERYDAVVLDLMMPVMNGRELLAVMRADAELASIPVVVCTALREPDVHGLGTACLLKPFEVTDLLAALHRVTGGQPARPWDGGTARRS
jgi:CheY-like chemotaxis protein